MKWLFKWILRLILLLIVLAVILVLSLDSILKAFTERRIRAETGMDVEIGKLSVGLLSPFVTIEDFKLYNTAEFGGTPFLDIRELHMEYDPAALARRELHVTLLRFNLAELDIVKNEVGRTNIVGLPSKPPPGTFKKKIAELQFTGIDVLNLSLGKARFIDLKNPRRNREWSLGVQNQIFKNVKTMEDLYGVMFLLWMRSGAGFSGAMNDSPENEMRGRPYSYRSDSIGSRFAAL